MGIAPMRTFLAAVEPGKAPLGIKTTKPMTTRTIPTTLIARMTFQLRKL